MDMELSADRQEKENDTAKRIFQLPTMSMITFLCHCAPGRIVLLHLSPATMRSYKQRPRTLEATTNSERVTDFQFFGTLPIIIACWARN